MSAVQREGDKAPTVWEAGVDVSGATSRTLRAQRLGDDDEVVLPTTMPGSDVTSVTHVTDGTLLAGQYDTALQVVWPDGTEVTFGVGTLTILPGL